MRHLPAGKSRGFSPKSSAASDRPVPREATNPCLSYRSRRDEKRVSRLPVGRGGRQAAVSVPPPQCRRRHAPRRQSARGAAGRHWLTSVPAPPPKRHGQSATASGPMRRATALQHPPPAHRACHGDREGESPLATSVPHRHRLRPYEAVSSRRLRQVAPTYPYAKRDEATGLALRSRQSDTPEKDSNPSPWGVSRLSGPLSAPALRQTIRRMPIRHRHVTAEPCGEPCGGFAQATRLHGTCHRCRRACGRSRCHSRQTGFDPRRRSQSRPRHVLGERCQVVPLALSRPPRRNAVRIGHRESNGNRRQCPPFVVGCRAGICHVVLVYALGHGVAEPTTGRRRHIAHRPSVRQEAVAECGTGER